MRLPFKQLPGAYLSLDPTSWWEDNHEPKPLAMIDPGSCVETLTLMILFCPRLRFKLEEYGCKLNLTDCKVADVVCDREDLVLLSIVEMDRKDQLLVAQTNIDDLNTFTKPKRTTKKLKREKCRWIVI